MVLEIPPADEGLFNGSVMRFSPLAADRSRRAFPAVDMSDLNLHLPLLTRFALAFGLALLLPRLMTRIGLPPVLGFIAAGALLGPALAGVLELYVLVVVFPETIPTVTAGSS